MKKFLISLAAVLGISMAASAQSPEIQVGYGGYTQMDAILQIHLVIDVSTE